MSSTYSIICRETKQRVWIGQGDRNSMSSFYSGDPKIMSNLAGFLNATIGKSLEFVRNDVNEFVYDFQEFGEPETNPTDRTF